MKRLFITIICLSLASCSGAELKKETITLTPVKANESTYLQKRLDKDGTLRLPFAAKSGHILFKLVDKALVPDINRDGKVDQTDAAAVKTNSFSVPVAINGKETAYPIHFQYFNDEEYGEIVVFQSGIDLAGKYGKQTVLLLDENINGSFGDGENDTIIIGNNAYLPGDLAFIGSDLYTLSTANDGTTVTLTPHTGPIASLTFDAPDKDWKTEAYVSKPKTKLSFSISSGTTINVIPGAYIVEYITQTKKVKGENYDFNARIAKKITLTEGSNSFSIAPPKKLLLTAGKTKDDPFKISIRNVTLVSKDGDLYDAQSYVTSKDDEYSDSSTLIAYIKAGDKEHKSEKTLEYG